MNKVLRLMLVTMIGVSSVAMSVAPVRAASNFNSSNLWDQRASSQSMANWNGQVVYVPQASYSYANPYPYNNDAQLRQTIWQLKALIAQLTASRYGGYYPYGNDGHNYGTGEVEAVTRSVGVIDDGAATLRGDINFNNSDEAVVYFEWGRSADNLSNQTTNVVVASRSRGVEITARLTRLEANRTYYFRVVAEDERGRITRGSILSFETRGGYSNNYYHDNNYNNNYNDEYPDINTGRVSAISNRSAQVNGTVDMNDFRNGEVFFVYGEDENRVDDVARDFNNFADVDERGNDLRKVRVDTRLDGRDSYRETISGLDNNTDIFYALCVAFEDEDNDEVIRCGNTVDFTTDYN